MKKRIISLLMAVVMLFAVCISAGAISWYKDSSLTVTYHLVPLLNDSAVGVPGSPSGDYDYFSLYSKATVTAYNSDSSVTATNTCTNVMYTNYYDSLLKEYVTYGVVCIIFTVLSLVGLSGNNGIQELNNEYEYAIYSMLGANKKTILLISTMRNLMLILGGFFYQ